jgi:hypothetical protein
LVQISLQMLSAHRDHMLDDILCQLAALAMREDDQQTRVYREHIRCGKTAPFPRP